MPHEAAIESLFLVTCYCYCCRYSEELHLGCLPSWLIGIYLGSLPQQLEDPCLQGSPKDMILYGHWCEPPVNDGSSNHCVVSGALPVSPVQTMSGSCYNNIQLGFLFSYLLCIFICLLSVLKYHNS